MSRWKLPYEIMALCLVQYEHSVNATSFLPSFLVYDVSSFTRGPRQSLILPDQYL